jgi:hypothetical protein
MRARTADVRTCCAHLRARVDAGVRSVPTHQRQTVRALSAIVDRVWLAAQAFLGASAFNANIGAWNTARVTTLQSVCAASGRAARRMQPGCARPGFDAAWPVVRGGNAEARACAHM